MVASKNEFAQPFLVIYISFSRVFTLTFCCCAQGQVPPYALPQIAQFAIQESVVKTVEAVVEAFGCKSLAGSDGEVNVNEDVAAMAKGYKNGDSLSFTATVKLALPATSVSEEAVEAVEAVADALDAEVVTEK